MPILYKAHILVLKVLYRTYYVVSSKHPISCALYGRHGTWSEISAGSFLQLTDPSSPVPAVSILRITPACILELKGSFASLSVSNIVKSVVLYFFISLQNQCIYNVNKNNWQNTLQFLLSHVRATLLNSPLSRPTYAGDLPIF